MSLTSTVLLVLAVGLLGFAWRLSQQIAERRARLISLQRALVDLLAERRTAAIKRAALLEQQELVEKTVKTGAETAETVHKAVADVAFGVMDAIPVTEEVSKLARGLHDGIAGSIYSTVRTSNTQIGGLAREFLKLKDEYDASRRSKGEAESDGDRAQDTAKHQQKTPKAKPDEAKEQKQDQQQGKNSSDQ